jgi:hypothetical protein
LRQGAVLDLRGRSEIGIALGLLKLGVSALNLLFDVTRVLESVALGLPPRAQLGTRLFEVG